jgi:predicted dehydrogenase
MADKIRIGFIACGSISHQHARRLFATGLAEIVALNDVSDQSLATFQEKFPETKDVPVYKDYREMLDAGGLDAVVIMSPHSAHFDQAMAAFDHNLHVLLEKPMVATVEQANKLIAKRDQLNKAFLISYQRHYLPEFRFMKQMIDSGDFGDVQFVSALQCQDWKRATAGTWRQEPSISGGGQLNDSGSHLLDSIMWMTGLRVESVYAFVDHLGASVDINSALALRFEGGAEGTISVVGEAPIWWEDITIWGTKAAFFLRNGKLSVKPYRADAFEPAALPESSDPDRNFVDAILGKADVESTPEGALRVIELTRAAWVSGKTGKVVKIGEPESAR